MRRKLIAGAALLALLMNSPNVSADESDVVIFGGEFDDEKPAPKPVKKPEPIRELPPPIETPVEPPAPVVEPPAPPSEPIVELPPQPEPVNEPEPQPQPQPVNEPEPQPQPVNEPEPQPQPQPVNEPEPEPQPQPVNEPEPQPQPQPVNEPEPQPQPQPVNEPEPQIEEVSDDDDLGDELIFDDISHRVPEPVNKPEPKPEPVKEPRPVDEPIIEPRPVDEPKPHHRTEPARQSDTTPKNLKQLNQRFIKLAVDETYIYYLDKTSVQWKKMPYSTTEYMADFWIRMIEREPQNSDDYYGENDSSLEILSAREKGYRYKPEDEAILRRQSYVLEHYYLRPKTKQIQFLCELEVFGRPQNTINERDYDYRNWENLVPGSVESAIYYSVVKVLDLTKDNPKGHMTVSDMLDEYLRISL